MMQPENRATIPALQVRKLRAGYPSAPDSSGLKTRLVIDNADFSVEPGSLTAILGANGSGKTTLLKTCIGLLKPLGGEISICGSPLRPMSTRARARLVAWVPQTSDSTWSFTAREVVSQGRFSVLGPFGAFRRVDRDAIEAALDALDASNLANRPFTELSGGEARRVLIARALAQDTRLLALDEPAAHLDPGRQMELMEILRKLTSAGKAVVVSLHDVNSARRFADRVLLLDRSGLSFFGPPESTLTPERLEDAYDTRFLHGDHEDYGRFVLPLSRKHKKGPSSP